MADLPSSASVVVIGAGIVGNSVVHHLAQLGWSDIVQIDKGPLPNPGGSTGHASNFIFPVDHSKEMTELTLESQRQFGALGVNTFCGGIEIARTEARMEELRRRMTSATAWGIEAHLLSPEAVGELVPFMKVGMLLGGFYTPSVSVVDSLRAGTLMRDGAIESGALTVLPNTEVLGIDTTGGSVRAIRTTRGTVQTDHAVIACGVWSPRIASMAGVTIPLTPAVHQMIDVGPIEVLQETGSEIGYPIVRDMDTFMYERQSGGSMEVGSYAHRPIFHDPDDIPSIEAARMSPTELPFTESDFDPQLEHAMELMPDILADAEIRYAINGLLSLTPDAMPLVGETEIGNLWSAAAIWIKEGPATGMALAQWMTNGYPEIDLHASDVGRFYDYQRTTHHIRQRSAEHFNKTYGIVHPREQWESERRLRVSPFYDREVALGAVFHEAGGWERPQWYESNRGLLETYGGRVPDRKDEWDGRWWSPIQNAEHLAMREFAGIFDLTAFAIFDLEGPGVVEYVESMTVNKCDVDIGRSVYTPLLTPTGGFKSDLTIMRLGGEKYRVVTGAFDGGRDKRWFQKWLPADRSVTIEDRTSALCTIGLWGPRARDILSSITSGDVSSEGLPFGSTKRVMIGSIPVRLFRVSYVGDLGWEIYTHTEHGPSVWDALFEAGAAHGVIPVGAGVYGTTGRLEKGYRLMGAELDAEYSPVEAGLARSKVKAADFIGKDAYLAEREREPAAILCTLTVEDHRSSSGTDRYPLGGNEPILTKDGSRIVDTKGRVSRVTSAGSAPSLQKYLLMAYLPPNLAVEGTELDVLYMNETFPVRVAIAGSTPLFDPGNQRMR